MNIAIIVIIILIVGLGITLFLLHGARKNEIRALVQERIEREEVETRERLKIKEGEIRNEQIENRDRASDVAGSISVLSDLARKRR